MLWHLAMQHSLEVYAIVCNWSWSLQKGVHDSGYTLDLRMNVNPIAAATCDRHMRDVRNALWPCITDNPIGSD